VIGKPPSIPWPEDINKAKSIVLVSPSLKKTVQLSHNAKAVKYKGRLWAKPGEKKRNRKTLFTSENLYTKSPHIMFPSTTEGDRVGDLPEKLFSLGVYMAEWLHLPPPVSTPSNRRTMTSVHIALYEAITEAQSGQNVSSRWLRIGYVVDILGKEGGSEIEVGADGGDLVLVDFIPNEVAKCMGVSDEDWVDLQYVSTAHCCYHYYYHYYY
jgi:hypothetical protein